MQAVVIHKLGGPEQLTLAEMPDPVAGPGEVLLDVAYAGCNWADTQVRTGLYPHPMTYPMVLGFEVSGTVAALGPGVGGVKAGARVIGTVGTPGKEKRALDYGAERVVLTREEDFEKAVLEFTGGKGVDLAIDSLGATMLDRTFNVVRKLGHVISIGEAEGQPFLHIPDRILPRSHTFTRLPLLHVAHSPPP